MQDGVLSDREDRNTRGKGLHRTFKKSKDMYIGNDHHKHYGEKSKGQHLYWRVYKRVTQISKGLAFKKYL